MDDSLCKINILNYRLLFAKAISYLRQFVIRGDYDNKNKEGMSFPQEVTANEEESRFKV